MPDDITEPIIDGNGDTPADPETETEETAVETRHPQPVPAPVPATIVASIKAKYGISNAPQTIASAIAAIPSDAQEEELVNGEPSELIDLNTD